MLVDRLDKAHSRDQQDDQYSGQSYHGECSNWRVTRILTSTYYTGFRGARLSTLTTAVFLSAFWQEEFVPNK